jgi:hypothetical protein
VAKRTEFNDGRGNVWYREYPEKRPSNPKNVGKARPKLPSARYWALAQKVDSSGRGGSEGFGLCDLQFCNEEGVNLAVDGAKAFASRTSSSHPTGSELGTWSPAEAINGSKAANNGWFGGNFQGQFIGYDFGEAVAIHTVKFACLTGYAWTLGQMIHLLHSNDMEMWVPAALIMPPYPAVEGETYSFDVLEKLAL